MKWTGPLQPGGDKELCSGSEANARRMRFGSLDAGPVDCSAQGALALRDDRYLVVLSPQSGWAQRQAVLQVAGGGQACRALPLLVAHCDAAAAASIAALPSVLRVMPALENLEETWPIVEGLDFLAGTHVAHQQGSGIAGTTGGHARGAMRGYPVLRPASGGLELHFDPGLDLAAEPALMPAINFSLGTYARDYPVTGNDAVNAATWGVAQEQLVVAAAGNCGTHPGVSSVSAWARMPHVLAVGATTDESGNELAPYSSTGTPDQSGSGPDLVACGNSAVDPSVQGTSFAAPRVTFMACLITAALLQLRHALQVCAGRDVEGIRLVGPGMLDAWARGGIWGRRAWARNGLPSLPAVGTDAAAVAALWRLIASQGLPVQIRGGVTLLHELLRSAARPMPGHGHWQVGAGFVSDDLVLDRLAAVTGADVLRWFVRDPRRVALMPDAARLRVFDRRALATMKEVVRASYPQWNVDWQTRSFAWRLQEGESIDAIGEAARWSGHPLPDETHG